MNGTQLQRQPASQSASAPDTHGSLRFIGTATTLLRFGGFTILTDPNFLHQGEQVHLGYGLRSTRQTNPALELRDLPHLDLVLLSHLHEDHFDRLVQRELDKNTRIVTTPQAAQALSKKGFAATYPLRTWQSLTLTKRGVSLHITSMPGTHARGPLAAAMPAVMGSLLEFTDAARNILLRMYITGDTLLYDQIREIPRRYPNIDLALLHLGGTRIMGLLLTMDAQQGVEALRLIAPDTAIPIHYDDYPVFKSPLSEFQQAVEGTPLANHVRYLQRGETYQFDVHHPTSAHEQ